MDGELADLQQQYMDLEIHQIWATLVIAVVLSVHSESDFWFWLNTLIGTGSAMFGIWAFIKSRKVKSKIYALISGG